MTLLVRDEEDVVDSQIAFHLGADLCVTPPFKYAISKTGTNPPGAHTISSLDGQGKAQVDQVVKSPTCSAASASTINTTLALGPGNVTYFWFYKAGVDTIKGSY